jgi:hypothetical protein
MRCFRQYIRGGWSRICAALSPSYRVLLPLYAVLSPFYIRGGFVIIRSGSSIIRGAFNIIRDAFIQHWTLFPYSFMYMYDFTIAFKKKRFHDCFDFTIDLIFLISRLLLKTLS